MALVKCLSKKELTVTPDLRQTRRIWVVACSSKTCQATAGGGCKPALSGGPCSSGCNSTRRRGRKYFGRDRTTARQEGEAGYLIWSRRSSSAPLRRRISA